ncbi:T9SS type A sorting domain-containing protein [Parabacteroides johnsonii]|uniref:T9SS type A sorting domain-containing protein n=1 Tax=Parabacteroides johnsonii TaxID=387661 RepID=UPI0011DCBAEC|nr:T9SS type A sorting domain-containing protein [Parabacteroides johnsonii]
MKRNKLIYNKWLRVLFLSFALLVGGGGAVLWGQTYTGPVMDESKRPTITLIPHYENGTIWHDSVFHDKKIIYAQPNTARELFIPELRNNIRGHQDERFNWFVHWYVVNKNGTAATNTSKLIKYKSVTITNSEATLQGGDWAGYLPTSHEIKDFFVKEQNGGLVWSKRIRDNIWNGTNDNGNGGYGMDASSIEFTFSENDIQQYDIYCDVSFYQDGSWSTNNSTITYTEPTLTKRYIYQVHNANEIKNILNQNTSSDDIETFEYDYPYKADNLTINFSMPYAPDNYFWDVNGQTVQGKKFQYQYQGINDNQWYAFRLSTRNNQRISLQQVQRIVNMNAYSKDKPITILIRVSDAEKETTNNVIDTQHGNTKLVAKYIFTPQENSSFMLDNDELKTNEDRWPRRHTEKYKLIGHVDFDMEKTTTQIQKGDNMSAEPFGFFKDNWTGYGFLRKGANILRRNGNVWTSNQNVYGLFRSADLNGISKDAEVAYTDQTNQEVKYMWPATITAYTKLQAQYVKTLYDRTAEISKESNNGTPNEFGYFYYIDASNDAGKLVEVPVDNICPNTELVVTAWIADMTRALYVDKDHPNTPLAPNINLIFKGIKHDKTEVILHRFTSCDALTNYQAGAGTGSGGTNQTANINLMWWQQLCYKFVVDKDISDVESFSLEVQNNEPHTDGADYAIDDIRIFMRKPEVVIAQAGDLCDTDVKTVRYVTSYSNLMTVMGLAHNEKVGGVNKDVNWNNPADPLPQELIDYLNNNYSNNQEDAVEYFTKIYYSVYKYDEKKGEIADRPEAIDYNGDDKTELYRVSYLSTRQKDMDWVNQSSGTGSKYMQDIIYSMPLDIGQYFDPEQLYVARISTQPLGINGESVKCETCSLVGDPFKISVAEDRFHIYDSKNTQTEIKGPEYAEQGKTYKIVGNFQYQENGIWQTLENASFDWFIGTLDEFNTAKVTVKNKEYTIYTALNEISTQQDSRNDFINALKNAFGEYSDTNLTGKFVFDKSFFEYEMVNKYQLIVGLPRAMQGTDISLTEDLYCTEPIEIQLGGTPPTIDPGDPDVPDPKDPDPDDPKDPDPKDPDDPDNPQPDKDPADGSHVRSVRVGLIQIQDMVNDNHNGTLRIPIHARTSTKEQLFTKANSTVNITVCETSDQEFKKQTNWSTQTIATLENLIDAGGDKPNWKQHYFKIKFNDAAIDKTNGFREGFWYMVNIPYIVKEGGKTVYENGIMKLTLKIVPEYVTWVGSETDMHNWNNDGAKHWRRSDDTELYTTDVASANGTHEDAYTPMRFTKVTILGNKDGKAYAAYPHLYELKKQSTTLPILNMNPTGKDVEIGAATKNIEYDLLADPDYEQELFGNSANPDKSKGYSYSCVRFYGNTCDEIYIKPESEILHTEYLTYNKAHVDYEMAPNRWYMLASPLKSVVSGDMYLPTGTGNVGKYARQETPAFGEINYDNTNYTRWKPAVYMRGWDKTAATVVRPNGSTNVNYGIKGSWSNLYNDVDVPFTPGTGFSIGTKTSGTNSKVLFRLPKVDKSYTYYGSTSGSGNETTLKNRTGNGRFYISPDEKGQNAATKCTASSTGGMFGNPFMSHLDMTKFLNGKSQNTYYIMTATGTTTNILGDEYSISTGDADPNYVAPLQSFIVKDLASAIFTTDMIAKAPATGKMGLRSATSSPADENLPQLRITATRDGVRNTAVVAGLVTASDSYVEGEDAALLINEEVAAPQVYTLAGNQMMAINVTPELAEIPLGIYGKDATPVELSFAVSGAMKNVKLVDKQTGKRYNVTDGLTLTVPGNTSGRYVLNGSIATSNEIIAQGRIIFYNSASGRIDISSVDPLSEVTVYDIAGRALRTLRNLNTPTASVEHLAPGIYVVRAESGSQVVSEKVEVK